MVGICEGAGADSVRVAKDDAERELIWRARKAAFAAMGLAPNYYVQDSVIPRTRLAEVLGQIEELALSTSSRWPMCSTPGTATCTRSSATTGASPTRPSAPRSWPA